MDQPVPPGRPATRSGFGVSAADWAADPFGRLEAAGLGPLFEQMPATIWATDHELRLIFVQGSLFHRIGVKAGVVLGRTIMDLLLDGREDHPMIHGHLTALAGCETSVRVEWGGEIYSARIAPLRDANGEVIGCVGINQITAWVPDNDGTLRESDVRLRRVIDSSMVGIVFTRDGAITDANDAFLELSGYSVEDLTTGQIQWPSLTPPDAHHEHLQLFEELRRDGRLSPVETEFLRKDGTRVSVLASAVRLSARRREAVGFVLDISAPKRQKHLLKMELADAKMELADAKMELADAKTELVRARAELTCASILFGAPAAAALSDWMREACRLLDWHGAVLWRATGPGTLGAPTLFNVSATHTAGIEPFALRALISGDWAAAESMGALVLPLSTGDGGVGVVAFVRPNGPAPTGRLIETMRSISLQAAMFLGRIG